MGITRGFGKKENWNRVLRSADNGSLRIGLRGILLRKEEEGLRFFGGIAFPTAGAAQEKKDRSVSSFSVHLPPHGRNPSLSFILTPTGNDFAQDPFSPGAVQPFSLDDPDRGNAGAGGCGYKLFRQAQGFFYGKPVQVKGRLDIGDRLPEKGF
jgi:hypothetical protein